MKPRKRQKCRAILKRLNKTILNQIDLTIYYDSFKGSPILESQYETREETDFLRLCEQMEKASSDIKEILKPKKKGPELKPARRVMILKKWKSEVVDKPSTSS